MTLVDVLYMATVYYLNWDREGNEEQRDLFHEAHMQDRGESEQNADGRSDEINTVPRNWYREVAKVDTIEREKIWKAFQGGVPVDSESEQMQSLKSEFVNAEDRSMSVGDIIELGSNPHMAVSIGFKPVNWE